MAEYGRISPRTAYTTVLLLLASVVGLYFVYQIRDVALAFALTLLLSVVLSAPVNLLTRLGLPRSLATLGVLGALGGAVFILILYVVPILRDEIGQLIETFPEILDRNVALANQALASLGLEDQVPLDTQTLTEAGRNLLTGDTLSLVAGVGVTVASLLSLGLVILLATVYLVARPQQWVEGFALLFPARRRERVREVLNNTYSALQKWILGQMASMLFIGVTTAVMLSLFGVPFALTLGVFSGLIAFIPYVGAIVGGIPPVLVALFQDPVTAIWVLVVYTLIQQIEGNLIQPVVMSRILNLHPAQVLFAILIAGTLFGVVGVVLAVPALVTVQILTNELWVKQMNREGYDPASSQKDKEQQDHQQDGNSAGRLRRALDAVRNTLGSPRS